jgi:hypothetical protein
LREDPNKPGLLFAGTERGVYVSSTMEILGKTKLESTAYPIRDLQIHKREKDLVATHGRAFGY